MSAIRSGGNVINWLRTDAWRWSFPQNDARYAPPDIAWGMIGEKRNVRKGADRFYQNIMLKQKDNAGV